MDANETVVLYTTNNMVEAQVLKNTLEDAGIACQIDSETSTLMGLVNIKLLIHAGDVERARPLVLAHEEHREPEPVGEDESESPKREGEFVANPPSRFGVSGKNP